MSFESADDRRREQWLASETSSGEPAGAHTMAAEDGARGDQALPSAKPGPRADATAGKEPHYVYGNAREGFTAERLLCDGQYETRSDFESSLDAYKWAKRPDPGTALEGTTIALAVDAVQAGVINADIRASRDYYERLVRIFTAQGRTEQVRLARRALHAMTALEVSL